jgi:hypothetical protein
MGLQFHLSFKPSMKAFHADDRVGCRILILPDASSRPNPARRHAPMSESQIRLDTELRTQFGMAARLAA